MCVRTVYSAEYICKPCLNDAKAVSHVLAAARDHVPELRQAPDAVLVSRMWRRVAPELGRELAEQLVLKYHTAWQLELGQPARKEWL